MKDPSTNDHPSLGSSNIAETNHDGDDDDGDAGSFGATTFVSASIGHDSRVALDDDSTLTTVSVHPGAIRVGPGGRRSLIHKEQGNEESESEEEDMSCTVPNRTDDGSRSDVDVPSLLPPSQVHGIVVQEPRWEDLVATVAALGQNQAPPIEQEQLQQAQDVQAIEVHESRLDALAAIVSALVHRQEQLESVSELLHRQEQLEQQPLIEAVMVQSSDENTRGGGDWENSKKHNNKMCGLPHWWIKWLLLFGTAMILVVVLVYFRVPRGCE